VAESADTVAPEIVQSITCSIQLKDPALSTSVCLTELPESKAECCLTGDCSLLEYPFRAPNMAYPTQCVQTVSRLQSSQDQSFPNLVHVCRIITLTDRCMPADHATCRKRPGIPKAEHLSHKLQTDATFHILLRQWGLDVTSPPHQLNEGSIAWCLIRPR
jgi:hypothetical protein